MGDNGRQVSSSSIKYQVYLRIIMIFKNSANKALRPEYDLESRLDF